jgi:hypothetical protein
MTLAAGAVRAGVLVVAIALAGAFLFGVWHVVVGGVVNGNPRAGTFGFVLAAVSGGLLAGFAVAYRRLRRARRIRDG